MLPSKVTVPFSFSPVMNESSCCSPYSPPFGGISVLDFDHSNRCIVVSRRFNLQFPNYIWCGASFHMLICHLYISFNEVTVHVFCPFFRIRLFIFLLVSFKSSFYIFNNSPSFSMSNANIFSQSVAYLLILLTVSLQSRRF